ncbi:MAG: ferredoxin [Lentisphaerae bacterium]|nr:ferredoxin [Lentisphaerota bacterium]
MTLYTALIIMGLLGVVLGGVIGIFVKIFKVEKDARAELALELLPGANCGGCGKAGCADFANALAAGEATPGNCPVSSYEQRSAIAYALGIDAGPVEMKQAVVCCLADLGAEEIDYNGVPDCNAANLVAGGPTTCRYGCLGLGSCARVCPFGAIEIIGRVAVVHPELCTGCGKCSDVCPRHVIRMVPAGTTVHVYCNSPEKGVVKRTFCQSACLGCRKCERMLPGRFKFNEFLALINYDYPIFLQAEDVEKCGCPAGCIMTEANRYQAAKTASAKGAK